MSGDDFGDRPARLVAAFRTLDSAKTGRLPTPLVMRLLTAFPDAALTAEEQKEFLQEADDEGFVEYEDFVHKVIFGPVD